MCPAMGTMFALPYVNLSVIFLEEEILFPVELPKVFPLKNCKLLEKLFKRNNFPLWPCSLDLIF